MARLSERAQTTAPAHLTKFERNIPGGEKWHFTTADWLILQLGDGIAYVYDSTASQELPQGGVIVCPPKSEITLMSSVLAGAKIRGTAIRIASLTGVLTAMERRCLETEVARQYAPFLTRPADHPLAKRVAQFFAQSQPPTLSDRLAFTHAFAEMVGPQLLEAMGQGKADAPNEQDAKGRLREFMNQISESDLASLSLTELANQLHCCERHASRLFREEWGVNFPAYVSEVRLKRACHLLLQGNQKIIDVALESGHGSLAHFNFVFKRRFRVTPTEWREKQMARTRQPGRSKMLEVAAMLVWLFLYAAGILQCFGAAEGSTNAVAQAPLLLKVDRYELTGNTLLSTDLVTKLLAPYTGDAVGTNTVAHAVGALQLEYFRRGFTTVKVSVPPQQVTNRVIEFQVTEGRLVAVKIKGNRYFSSNNIMTWLPYVKSLESGDRIFNTNIFQTELDRANANPDRQIFPKIGAGPEPGTSALTLEVKDRLPLHGRLDLDNYSPPGTPELRMNANASYANLWDLEHTLGLQYGFSPDRLKPSDEGTHVSLYPIDAPEVSYYSGFYRAPFGQPAAVENQISQDPNHFGYNETTKQFVQPPATGQPEFTGYASRSTTGPTMFGPKQTVVNTPNQLVIQQQLVTQQYTSQTTAGGRLSYPLPMWQNIQSSFSFGMDFKEDKVVTLPTNYFYSTAYVKEGNNPNSPLVPIPSTIAVQGVGSTPSLQYTPIFLGWTGSRRDHWGQFREPVDRWSEFDGGVSLVAGTGGTFSRARPFPILIANSKEATTEFIAVRPQLSRTQVLPDNFSLYGNLSGQWANEPLLNLEQFELGGNGSIRGYREGELYADTGWYSQVEFRSPYYWRGSGWRLGTQFTGFSDYGEGYHLDPSAAANTEQSLWGAGAAVNFKFGAYVESHIIVAWPLLNSAFSRSGHERISFSLSGQL